MNSNKVFRVLVALPLASVAGRKKLSGIHRFMSEGHTWDVELVRNERDFADGVAKGSSAAEYDGCVIGFTDNDAFRGAGRQPAVPIVFIDYPDARTLRDQRHSVFIHDDAIAIARTAVAKLRQSVGTQTFGFVPTRKPTRWSTERQQAFAAEMKRHGSSVRVFDQPGDDRDALARWLERLPKPAAILAAFDDRAVDVLEACRRLGIAVPRQVEVLGIGDDAAICEASSPSISSLAVDFESQGYRAARELQAMMLHRAPRVRTFKFGVLDTALRASTHNRNNPKQLVRRALDYIGEHAARGITAADVVHYLRVSRRLADLRFREETGTTINATILARRLDAVKRLLRETDLPIAAIAMRCGYPDANYLKNLFRRKNGLSMRAFRKQSPCSGARVLSKDA